MPLEASTSFINNNRRFIMRKIKHQSLKMAALATVVATSAAVLPSVAQATTFAEPTDIADFSNSSAAPTLLPAGTDVVIGSVPDFLDLDFFQFTNLVGNTPYSLNITGLVCTDVYVDSALFGGGCTDGTINPTGTVPVNGQLLVGIDYNEGTTNYTATLTAQQSVPEPEILSLAALGLAGVAASRKLSAKKA
jgi:PEP-CTERM motif